MSKLGKIAQYVHENWELVRRPYVCQVDSSTALFHNGECGILGITSRNTDMTYVRENIPPIPFVPLFYGDGETFYRSAKESLVKKLEHARHVGSLWKYSANEISSGLLLHELERSALSNGEIYYFHPKPTKTQDVIGAYDLVPFKFDYTRHTLVDIVPKHRTSSEYFHYRDGLLNSMRFVMGKFSLENGKISEFREPEVVPLSRNGLLI